MNDFTQSLFVDYCSTQLIAMGRLAYMNRKIAFEYTPKFLELGFELSPFKLPLKPGVQFSTDTVFEGLFGVFNDSLPDGWGRLLLDRKLRNQGILISTFLTLLLPCSSAQSFTLPRYIPRFHQRKCGGRQSQLHPSSILF